MPHKSKNLVMPKIHYTRFPVTSPYIDGKVGNLLRTCYGLAGKLVQWILVLTRHKTAANLVMK